MKWTVKARTTDGVIHSIEVESGNIEALPLALEQIAARKKITLKDIVSIEPHHAIKNQSI